MNALPSFSLILWIGALAAGIYIAFRLLNPNALQNGRDKPRSDGSGSSGPYASETSKGSDSDSGGGDGGGGGD